MSDEQPYRSESYWTSPHNWEDPPDLSGDIRFHDTTFRDGEQQPGVVFTEEEKVELGKLYSDVGIDRIEVGIPSVSEGDLNAIERLANEDLDAEVFALTRCVKEEARMAVEAGVDGLVMEIPSSRHLIENAYEWTYDQAIEYASEATRYAGDEGVHVSFFCIDSTRADPEDFRRVLERVIEEGHADSLNIVDTFGALNPRGTRAIVNFLGDNFDLPIEAHLHNDFGLGVANTIAAFEAGAEVAHTTVTGLGERSGNGNFEEVATSLQALYGVDLDLDFGRFTELAERTAEASGVPIHESKPVVGENQFGIEAGIIVAWWNELRKKDMPLTMYPYHWELVGQSEPRIALGKMSGIANVQYWLERLDLDVPSDDRQEELLSRVKDRSIDEERELGVEEFVDIYRAVVDGE